jgi:hypothetical protein
MPAAGQTTGPVAFDVTSSALTGTVSCNGGAAVTIAPVDASTTDVTGSNDNKASNLSSTACGLPLYSIGYVDDSSSAQDTSSQDEGDGNSTEQNVSLLGGVVTYTAKTETGGCVDVGQTVNCQDTTTISNLYFAGQHIVGNFTQPRTFNATSLSVQVPGYCLGAALFTGSLTVAGSSASANGNAEAVSMAPLALEGTLTCVGLRLTSVKVALKDLAELEWNDPINAPPLLSQYVYAL